MKRPADLGLREFHRMYTSAPELEALFAMLPRIAEAGCTVLVRGETGSGKELVARALHELSTRSRGPFQAINCATLSPNLLESELFGHVRGAFTGAIGDRDGLFKLADKGTLFLDEIAEIPLDLQARLLRVLQNQTFTPVGSTKSLTVDVRLISATHTALRRAVAEGRFRDDLRYRIRVVPIFLPPLRDRTGDVEALLWHLIDEFNRRGLRKIDGVEREVMEAMKAYPWPGNIRELRNVVEYTFVIGEGPVLSVAELPPELRGEGPPEDTDNVSDALQVAERERLLSALARSGGRRAKAAEKLGISRSTLWRKLRQHGLA